MIYCDNQSYVKLLENLVFHEKLKHIDIRYYFIQDMVQKGVVKLQYISKDENIVDILIKPLSTEKFVYFRDKLGVVENVFLTERKCRCLGHHWTYILLGIAMVFGSVGHSVLIHGG